MGNISLKNKKFKTFSSIVWENICKSSTWCHLKFMNSWVYAFITKYMTNTVVAFYFNHSVFGRWYQKVAEREAFWTCNVSDWNFQDLFVVTSCDGKDKIQCILYSTFFNRGRKKKTLLKSVYQKYRAVVISYKMAEIRYPKGR